MKWQNIIAVQRQVWPCWVPKDLYQQIIQMCQPSLHTLVQGSPLPPSPILAWDKTAHLDREKETKNAFAIFSAID